MSFTIHGIGVSGGIAIGHAQLVSHAQLEVAHYEIPKSRIPEEKARFDAAIVTARPNGTVWNATLPASARPGAKLTAAVASSAVATAVDVMGRTPYMARRYHACSGPRR